MRATVLQLRNKKDFLYGNANSQFPILSDITAAIAYIIVPYNTGAHKELHHFLRKLSARRQVHIAMAGPPAQKPSVDFVKPLVKISEDSGHQSWHLLQKEL